MTYTNQEMVFFNSLLDGKQIFGIHVEAPIMANKKYIEDTISSLKKKGIINAENKLVHNKKNPALYLDIYKKSDKYIILNENRIALTGNDFVTIINHTEDEFEINSMSRIALMISLIENTALLREDAFNWETKEKEKMSFDLFKKHYENMQVEDATIIQKYNQTKLLEDYFLYWNDTSAFLYDGINNFLQEVNGQTIRDLFVDILEIDMTEEK